MLRAVSMVLMAALLVLPALGCGKKGGKDDTAKKAFKPGKLVDYKNDKIGFSVQKPDNVPVVVKGDVAELKAEGFPLIRITLRKTKENSKGSSSSGGMGKYRRRVFAPMRTLECKCEDTGQFEDLVKTICRSMMNTAEAPKKPTVDFGTPKVTGKIKAIPAFVKSLEALKPKILECWKKAVAADPKLPQGHLNFQLTYKDDGSRKQSNVTRTFNYKKDKPLAECVEKLVNSVKPEPDGGEVKLEWYLKFKLY